MIDRPTRPIAVLALSFLMLVPLAAQQGSEGWYGRTGAKSDDFAPLKIYASSFKIEVPKNWQLVPGHTGTLFSTTEKTKRSQVGAAMIVEHMRLQAAIDPSILGSLGEELLKDVQAREPSGSGFTQQVLTAGARSLILIQYDRPGLSGGPDHVVQYSIPMGTIMYNLICIAPKAAIEKYRGMFAYTAASFAPVDTGS